MDKEASRESSPEPDPMDELFVVVKQARGGDSSVVPRLRAILTERPQLYHHYGNLAKQAEAAWVALAAGPDLFLKECLLHQTEDMRNGLIRPSSPPLESLLVERVVATWLQLQYFAAMEAQVHVKGEGVKLLQFYSKRQASAQKLYESSLAALLTFQKLVPILDPVPIPILDTVPIPMQEATVPISVEQKEPNYTAESGDFRNRIERFFATSDSVSHTVPSEHRLVATGSG